MSPRGGDDHLRRRTDVAVGKDHALVSRYPWLFPTLLLPYALGYYVIAATGREELIVFQGALGLGVACLAIPRQRGRGLFYPLLLLTLGAAVFFFRGEGSWIPLRAFSRLSDAFPLILFTPIIGVIYDRRNYVAAVLYAAFRRLRKDWQAYGALFGLANISGATMASASIIVLYRMLGKAAEGGAADRFLATSILRGFASGRMWSPNSMAFPIVVQSLQASVLPVMMMGLGMTVITGTLVTVGMWWASSRGGVLAGEAEQAASSEGPPDSGQSVEPEARDRSARVIRRLMEAAGAEDAEDPGRVREFLLITVSFLALVVVAGTYVPLRFTAVVPLVAISYTTVFFLARAREGVFLVDGVVRLWKGLSRRSGEVASIMSAGVLVTALEETGFGRQVLFAFQEYLRAAGIPELLGIVLVMVVVSFAGFPPMPLAVIVSGTIDPTVMPFSGELLTFAIMGAVGVSMLIGPTTLPVLILSGQLRTDPVRIGMAWNWRYALVCLFSLQLFLYGLARFLPS